MKLENYTKLQYRQRSKIFIKLNQREKQDERSNVVEETLQEGDKVFVHIQKIQGKLEQKYKGPFKVDSVTPKHNYNLRNRNNKLLKHAYPLNKLKTVESEVAKILSDEEESENEIEKVSNSRIRKGKKEYLIKYRDESKNVWVPENELRSLQEIDKYNEDINRGQEINYVYGGNKTRFMKNNNKNERNNYRKNYPKQNYKQFS